MATVPKVGFRDVLGQRVIVIPIFFLVGVVCALILPGYQYFIIIFAVNYLVLMGVMLNRVVNSKHKAAADAFIASLISVILAYILNYIFPIFDSLLYNLIFYDILIMLPNICLGYRSSRIRTKKQNTIW